MKTKNDQNPSGLAPSLPRNTTLWGFEFLAKNLAPCVCGGVAIQIEGGSPKTFRFYCSNTHAASVCLIETADCVTLGDAVFEWNKIQINKGFDPRKLHPLNQ